jgi:DNA-binding Lrp family transcriptional regulator
MNGRMPMSVLGRMVGLKESTAKYRVEKLEKLFSIRYIAEIDVQKLGYLSFLIAVKFIDKKPSRMVLKAILDAEPRIQIATQTHGDHDLLMYVLAKNNAEAIILVAGLRKHLLEYNSKWNVWPIDTRYGMVPLRGAFIDLLKDSILKREYVVLKELNKNGRMEFTEIDSKHGFDPGRAQYSYHKLKESGLLRRVTITMQNMPVKYIAVISASIINEGRFRASREGYIRSVIENQNTPINKYLLVSDTAAPDGVMLYLPVFGSDDLDKDVEKLNSLKLGIEFSTEIATNLLVGEFCYRSFDNALTEWQTALETEYGSKIVEKTDYEETGRNRKSRVNYKVDIRGIKIGKEED